MQNLSQSLKLSAAALPSKLESTPFSRRAEFSIKKSPETLLDKSSSSLQISNLNNLIMSIKKTKEKELVTSNFDFAHPYLKTSSKNVYESTSTSLLTSEKSSYLRDSGKKNKPISSMFSPHNKVENNSVLSLLGRQKADFLNKKGEIYKI